jgi:hypothetical protein
MSILVFCPSRGRPDKMREAAASLISTRRNGDTELVVVLDIDDPTANDYMKRDAPYRFLQIEHAGGMVAALNAAVAKVLAEESGPTILGFIGDDHRFRTDGWDTRIREALEQPGFAYGEDLFQHSRLPTQVFISRPIVEALGYFALPDCHHLYVDDAWMALGQATDSIHFLPDVVIEHMHPLIGKGEWDEGYKRVNAPTIYTKDEQAFQAWVNSDRFREDVGKVRSATEAIAA